MRNSPRTSGRLLLACVVFTLAATPSVLASFEWRPEPGRAEALPDDGGGEAQHPAAVPETLDDILKQAATYDGGINSAALWKLRAYVYARKDDPAGRAECEAKLLQFLKNAATPAAKMAASRHLRVIASDTAVPALQALLADPRSADLALYVLQQIPGVVAERALLQALKTTSGETKVAVIAALGERRSAAAVPALAPLMAQPAFGVPAATAIGRIGGVEAAAALLEAYAGASPALKPIVAAAVLETSGRLAAEDPLAVRRLYDTLLADASLPVPARKAAAAGRLSVAGPAAASLLLDMLGSSDPDMQEVAVGRIADVFPTEAIAPVCEALPGLPPRAQMQVLAVLSGYPAEDVLPAVKQAAQSEVLPVRLAGLQALGAVGGPSVVTLLAVRAAAVTGPEQAAARAALGALKGSAVDDVIALLLQQHLPDAVAGELLLAAVDRRIVAAKGLVVAALSSPSPELRIQALRALRTVGTPSDIPAVLDRLLASADDRERAEAEQTTGALAHRIARPDGRGRHVKSRLSAEKAPEARATLISVLPLVGDDSALPLVRTALRDSSAEVVDAAVRAMAAWPTGAAQDDLLVLAKDARDDTHRLLAIAGFVRIVALGAYRRPEAAVADLKLAMGYAWRPEEKRLVLGALASFPCQEALDLATGLLNEPEVKAEARAAIETIEQRLAKGVAR